MRPAPCRPVWLLSHFLTGLCRCRLSPARCCAASSARRVSVTQHGAPGPHIHLPFERLQAIVPSLGLTGTPWLAQPGTHRVQIRAEFRPERRNGAMPEA